MKPASRIILSTSPPAQTGGKPPGLPALRCRKRLPCWGIRHRPAVKELDSETGLYYYGARYLDPKTGRWLSGDPAISEYVPSAPVSDEARKRNGSLPGQGGVFNVVNLHVYHYAGNNPVKYVDPDGETPKHASARNAFNLDFGRDYANLATANFNEGEYGWAAVMVLDSVFEAAYDLALAFTGAYLIGSVATGVSVWALDHLARGRAIERRLGGMDNNFPVIDKINSVVKTAENAITINSMTSIKSIDTLAQTYQRGNAFYNKIMGYSRELAGFSRTRYKDTTYTVAQGAQKTLQLALRRDGVSADQARQLQQAVIDAQKIGVQIITNYID